MSSVNRGFDQRAKQNFIAAEVGRVMKLGFQSVSHFIGFVGISASLEMVQQFPIPH